MSWFKFKPKVDLSKETISITWNPQPDITTYELALCIKVLLYKFPNRAALENNFNNQPDDVKRHFICKTL